MNNKGFNLVELMICVAIVGILAPVMGKLTVNLTKTMVQAQKATAALSDATTSNPAVTPGADQRTYLPTQGQCVLLKGTNFNGIQWYAKRVDSDTVQFYKNSATCASSTSLGTLTAQTNPTYDDDATDTFWNVSSASTTLRVLVRKLNLPKN